MSNLGPLLTDYAGWIAAFGTASTSFFILWRRGRKAVSTFNDKFNQVSDVLLGRPSIIHPETGEELAPAAPGIGTRMAHIERWQSEVVPILKQIADTQASHELLASRIDNLRDDLRSLRSSVEVHIDEHRNSA